ncbi:MAG: YbfB/YjiJ family MFS transporter [Acidimicrobiales bacterium]
MNRWRVGGRSNAAVGLATLVAGGFGLMVAMVIGRFALTPILPFMRDEAGMSNAQAGFVASGTYVGYLLGVAMSARIIRRFEATTVARGGLVAVTVGTAAMAVTADWIVWTGIRTVIGMGSGLAFVAISSIAFAVVQRLQRPHLIALTFTGIGSGIVISTVVVWLLALVPMGAPAMWIGVAAIAVLATMVVLVLLVDEEPEDGAARAGHSEPARPAALAVRSRRLEPGLAWLIVGYGLSGFGYVVAATYLVVIARDADLGRTFEMLSWIAVGVSSLGSVPLWTAVAGRIGDRGALMGALAMQGFGVAALAVRASPATLVFCAATLGLSFVAITTLALTLARRIAPGRATSAIAQVTITYGIGQIVGPVVAGAVADWAGDFRLACALAAVALAVAVAVTTRIPQPRPAAPSTGTVGGDDPAVVTPRS